MKKYVSALLLMIAPFVFTLADKYISIYTSTNWSLGIIRSLFPILLALLLVMLDYCAVFTRTKSKSEGICFLIIGIIQLLTPFLIITPLGNVVNMLNIYNTSTLITYYVHALFAILFGVSEICKGSRG